METLNIFATLVTAALATEGLDMFGTRKVFLCGLKDALCCNAIAAHGTAAVLGDIDAQLVACHQAGLLTLARADLVAAMDPELVRWSHVSGNGADFHFLVVG